VAALLENRKGHFAVSWSRYFDLLKPKKIKYYIKPTDNLLHQKTKFLADTYGSITL